MKTKTISRLFYIWQGHQITDEEIYNSPGGEYNIYTGQNEIKGKTLSPYITDVPAITIPSKGIINNIYLQNSAFDANNTIALIPKERSELDLEFFILSFSEYITSFISSTSTNNYLNKAILKGIEITYPEIDKQIKIKNKIKHFNSLLDKINAIKSNIVKVLTQSINYTGKSKRITDIFDIKVGCDDNMTEFFSYNNYGSIPIYSGASDNNGIFRYTNRIDFNFPEYITWSISGKAGKMFLRKGPCCLTRDCGILIPKNKDEILLEWFVVVKEKDLMNFAIGNGGLGRLKKNLISIFTFILPQIQEQELTLKKIKNLQKLLKKLEGLELKLRTNLLSIKII